MPGLVNLGKPRSLLTAGRAVSGVKDATLKAGAGVSQLLPDGLFTRQQADLDDQSKITGQSGTVTLSAGKATLGASSSITLANTGPLTGNYWISTIVDMVVSGSGAYRPRFLNATYAPEALRSREGYHVWKFPSLAGSLDLNFLTGAGFAGDLLGMQIHDMAAILAQPADGYIAAGQSNMACTTNGLGNDPLIDIWPDKRCLYFPGTTQAVYGAVQGQPSACVAPLQTNGVSDGVSPACEFARVIAQRTPSNRNVVIIQAAQGGTGLVASDAAWNSDGSNPTAYNAAVSLVNAAMAALPAGSVIKGVLWAQGETDSVSADMSAYPPAWANMRSDFESAIGSGQLPWIFILPPADATRNYQAELIAIQQAMDEDSGSGHAKTKVHSVARPTGFMEDTTHVNAAGQRIAGRFAANRFIAEGYLG